MLHSLRYGSKRSPPSSSLDSRERRHGFQTRNFGPFHAPFRGFLDVSAVPTVSDHGRLICRFGGRLAPLRRGSARSIDSRCCDCGSPEATRRKHATYYCRYQDSLHLKLAARWPAITVRTSVAGPLPVRHFVNPWRQRAPGRHVLAPAAAPRSWIPICSASLVSWGHSRLWRRGVDDVPITARQYCDNYRQPRLGIFHWSRPYQEIQIESDPHVSGAGIRSIHLGSDMRC